MVNILLTTFSDKLTGRKFLYLEFNLTEVCMNFIEVCLHGSSWHWLKKHVCLEPLSRPGAHFSNDLFQFNLNLMAISRCSYPNFDELIATNFCAWHNNYAVLTFFCYKNYNNMITWDGITVDWNFNQIWNTVEQLSAQWMLIYCLRDPC